MKRITVPGKLMLTGEWAILEPGSSCIVMAVNHTLTAVIEETSSDQATESQTTITFSLADIQLPIITTQYIHGNLVTLTELSEEQEKQFALCRIGAEVALRYLERSHTINSCTLTINSEISSITLKDGSLQKLGFGSSAAAVVATIKALFAHAGYTISSPDNLERIFKLAIIAHYQAQGKCGSGFDIAAATYGTTLIYTRYNQTWFDTQSTPLTCIDEPWPDLSITPIALPKNIIVLVGFSGVSAQTRSFITAMQTFKKQDQKSYYAIMQAIQDIVKKVQENLTGTEKQNPETLLSLINQNRDYLRVLSQKSGIELEIAPLTTLISIAQKHGAAAKFSGAGGGDCGIALCSSQEQAEKIKHDWHEAGIIPIDMSIL